MGGPRQLFILMNIIFIGFGLSALYWALSAAALWGFGHGADFTRYSEAYFQTFNCAISGGLVFATAGLVWWTQKEIPLIIENNFTQTQLATTTYFIQKRKFLDPRRTIAHSTFFAISALIIFYFAKFPFEGLPEYLLIGAGCLQYALGVYIGRKTFNIAQMLYAIGNIRVTKDLFTKDSLSGISTYVNAVSTLTAISVYVGVVSYYHAPFKYSYVVGTSVRTLMLLPAIIAIPVLLFAYHQRAIVRKTYEKSIEYMLRKIRNKAEQDNLSEFERLARILELNKLLHDELNYRLRITLEDLPIAVTIGIALLSAAQT